VTTEPEPTTVVVGLPVLPGPWRVERIASPGPDHDDHVHLIAARDRGVATIVQVGERGDAEADAIAALLGAARDLRTALAASRRALERADGVPYRPLLLSLIDGALAKAGGGTP
jgi:hypothetical protein